MTNAAAMIDASADHVYRMIKAGYLPTVQIGLGRSKTRIRVTDLEKMIAQMSF